MDFQKLFDYIIPIVFILAWAFAQLMAKKSQNKDFPQDEQEMDEPEDDYFEELFGPKPISKKPEPQAKTRTQPTFAPPPREFTQAKTPPKPDYIAKLEKERATLASLEQQFQTVKQRREALQKQEESWGRTKDYTPLKTQEIIDSFKGPNATKKAILYYEILGQPIGSRKNGHMGPIWNE